MRERKYQDLKLGESGAIISIIAYICLSCLKLFIGFISNSEALKADGLNNTTDIIASIAVLIGLRISQRPPDNDHAYGHRKSEAIGSLVASFIMFAVGTQVLIEALPTFLNGGRTAPDMMAGYVGIFSGGIMYFVYRHNKKLAIKINSQSLLAASKDNISDAWVSIGTAIGIFGSQLNMPWLDTVTAVIVAILICKTAWNIFKDASLQLTDAFDENKITLYKKVLQSIPQVKGIKDIRGRYYGNNAVVDVIILVNPTLDINEAHKIASLVETTLKEEQHVYEIHVKVEPQVYKKA
jgi:cation diffusion facilitator family transporter